MPGQLYFNNNEGAGEGEGFKYSIQDWRIAIIDQ